MVVHATDGSFQVVNGAFEFKPTASEIYAVIFESASSIRGVGVSITDFHDHGIEFSEFIADPIIVLDVAPQPAGPGIVCNFRARSGSIEGKVPFDGETPLDYAIGAGRWMPLPTGAVAEAQKMLEEAGLSSFGVITLAQYMRVCHWLGKCITVVDRTENELAATRVAPTLVGDLPKDFVGKLYTYQFDGYRWLSFMARSGLGGIIADEMGLGKTVQIICLLLDSRPNNLAPNLIIAPTTLLENWRRELARFAPTLKVLAHAGSRRTGLQSDLYLHDVVICSFETAVIDISLFRNIRWHFLVVDEAQNIRNPRARRTVQLKTIPRTCAFAVTGTPIENQLLDLWSITDFVLPSMLGSLDNFATRHPNTIPGAASLEPNISPLILRRTIAQVGGDLPERIDIPQALELDQRSAHVYEEIREAAAQHRTPGASLAGLQKLRMFCTHPWLTSHFVATVAATDCSVKMLRLLEIMEEVVSKDGKAIVFTSYKGSIDLIRAEITARFGIFAETIDGRVAVLDRQRIVDRFSDQKSGAVLVLNPKAAGVGLNITAANHVIHFNLEWNPAVEDQASARAHRRGQTRAVTVHRLFYVNTVEEIMDDRMQRKRDLASAAILGSDGQTGDMDDLLRALRISPISPH